MLATSQAYWLLPITVSIFAAPVPLNNFVD
jgi:hypothetical protein